MANTIETAGSGVDVMRWDEFAHVRLSGELPITRSRENGVLNIQDTSKTGEKQTVDIRCRLKRTQAPHSVEAVRLPSANVKYRTK